MSQRERTAVIGGGMAGCAAAKELIKAGREVVIFEAAAGLGGRARSWHRSEIEPSVGINLWFTSFYKLMFERIHEYGLEDQLVEMSNNVIVVDKGQPAELLSDSLRSLLTYKHVALKDRIGFLTGTMKETLKRKQLDIFDPIKLAPFDDGTTAAEYARKSLSQRGFDNLLRPEIESFWLWRCEDISAAHVRAMQAQVAGAKFYVFRNGMEVIAERNAEGADIRLEHEVTDLQVTDGRVHITARSADGESHAEVFDDVVVATTAPVAAKLTAALPNDIVGRDTREFLETQVYEPALSVSYLVDFSSMPSEAHIVAAGADDPPVKTIITFPRKVKDEQGRSVDKHLAFVYPGRAETRGSSRCRRRSSTRRRPGWSPSCGRTSRSTRRSRSRSPYARTRCRCPRPAATGCPRASSDSSTRRWSSRATTSPRRSRRRRCSPASGPPRS